MSKFLFSFGVIASGLSAGYLIQILVGKGVCTLPIEIERLRKLLIKIALLFFNPVTVIGAIWSIRITDPKIIVLPFIGIFAMLLGGAWALLVSKPLRLDRKATGSFFACGFYTNTGAIGALICFVFLGEIGFALAAIYRLFEEFLFYTVGFSVARLYGSNRIERETGLGPVPLIRSLLRDPFIFISVVGITIGTLFRLSGLQRPEFYSMVITLFVPLQTILLLISIGLAMKVNRIRHYLRPCVAISVVKFVIVPLTVTLSAWLLGYREAGNGLFLKVVMILSSMPVAFTAFVPPTLYRLDMDLVNSCWLFTTGMLTVTLPALYVLIHLV